MAGLDLRDGILAAVWGLQPGLSAIWPAGEFGGCRGSKQSLSARPEPTRASESGTVVDICLSFAPLWGARIVFVFGNPPEGRAFWSFSYPPVRACLIAGTIRTFCTGITTCDDQHGITCNHLLPYRGTRSITKSDSEHHISRPGASLFILGTSLFLATFPVAVGNM